jgi:MarR family transcriptional regulator, organic hydroperoxide resistance regulator
MSSSFPTRYESPKDSIGFQFWKTSNLWRRKQQEALRAFDISHGQFIIIACTVNLENKGEEIYQKDIASLSQTDEMTTSQIINALQKKGILSKERSLKDKRAFRIQSTDIGKDLLIKTFPIVEEVDETFFKSLKKNRELFIQSLITMQY